MAANSEADLLAGEAARVHAVPSHVAKPIVQMINNLTLVQNRLVAVIQDLLPRHIPKSPKVDRVSKWQIT